MVVDDLVVLDDQVVTEDRGHVHFFDERVGEFLEGIAQDDHLGFVAERVQKVHCTVEQRKGSDDFLNVGKLQIFPFENF